MDGKFNDESQTLEFNNFLEEYLTAEEKQELKKYREERKKNKNNKSDVDKNNNVPKYTKNIIGETSFYNFLKTKQFKEFRLPSTETDKCSFCEDIYKVLIYYTQLKEKKDIDTETKTNTIKYLENILRLGRYHKQEVMTAKKAYENYIEFLMEGEALILIDFSEKVQLCPRRQPGSLFYDPFLILYLAFILFVKINGIVHKYRINVFSEHLTQDTLTVTTALTKVMEEDWVKELKIKKYYVWSDGARHFKSFNFIGKFFIFLVFNIPHIFFFF